MSATLPMLPWFPRDFLAATRGWSVTQKGLYRELLDLQWELGYLPADPSELQRLIQASDDEWHAAWPKCASKFAPTAGGIQNARLEAIRSESLRLRAKRVAAAERTNAERHAHRDADRNGDCAAERLAERDAQRRLLSIPILSSPESGDSSGISRAPNRTDRAFHDQVIAAYHEALPSLSRVKVWSRKRRQALDARIRERVADGKPADGLAYWQNFFAEVAASDFLCGRGSKSDWCCDLEWLLRPENFAKTIEGRYSRSRGNGSAAHAA
jgi:uncharacterized protein YdaU (DUF1376 family)